MGFEPMVSALVLQCSTNFAMKMHTLGASQFFEFNFGLTIAWIPITTVMIIFPFKFGFILFIIVPFHYSFTGIMQ